MPIRSEAYGKREYDNAALYADTDAEQAEQLERSRSNFIEYFDHVQRTRRAHSSDSIIVNWRRVHELLKIFAKGDTILFSQIDLKAGRIVPSIHNERTARRY